MPEHIQGTFHFHSTYSHDGRSSLAEVASQLHDAGFSFCVMTDHFEDFDEAKFDRYIHEMVEVSKSSGLLFVPGMEVDLEGLHTIVFPVRKFGQLLDLSGPDASPMFKVLAHPSKYPLDKIADHLDKYRIDGIELWNQQADGSYVPPFLVLESLKGRLSQKRYRYFFGCDIHNVKLAVRNLISIEKPRLLSVESIIAALTSGDFVSRNIPTRLEYRNGSQAIDFDTWMETLHDGSYRLGKILGGMRRTLRATYKMLPRPAQRSLNDVKNLIRSHF